MSLKTFSARPSRAFRLAEPLRGGHSRATLPDEPLQEDFRKLAFANSLRNRTFSGFPAKMAKEQLDLQEN